MKSKLISKKPKPTGKRRRWALWRDQWRMFRESQAAGTPRNWFPNADLPWKLAEDRRLLRLHARHSKNLSGLLLWVQISIVLGRTSNAVLTRYNSLLAGQRLARASR